MSSNFGAPDGVGTGSRKRCPIGAKLVRYLLLIALLVAVDQLTKFWALQSLSEPVTVLDSVLGLRLIGNNGAAWGMLSGKRWFLLLSPIVAVAAAAVFLVRTMKRDHAALSLGIALVMAGGIGNWADRAFRGGVVVDFLEFLFIDFPVFNFADICVSIGAVAIGYYLLFVEGRKHE